MKNKWPIPVITLLAFSFSLPLPKSFAANDTTDGLCNLAAAAAIGKDGGVSPSPQCTGGGGGGGGTVPPVTGLERGGSNFNWYTTSCSASNQDPYDREPYGVIANYNTQTSAIRNALSQMRAAGQARLRLMVDFGHGLTSGTLMDSTGGHLSAQNMSNLVNLVADFRTYGFSEIEISFGAEGPNSPFAWSTWNQALADENWSVIYSVHQALQSSGIRILYDLGNEMMTSSQTNQRYRYMKYIWPKYNSLYASLYDSVGFSFASGEISAISNMSAVYGHNSYPALVDIHIYPYGANTAADLIYAAAHNLGPIGAQPGQYRWIIGEANFNSLADARSMALALNALAPTDSRPWYLLQWPINPANPYCTVANVAPFDNYATYGF